ncbi:MAG: glycosyltransferase family 2 protein [Cyanobacteria bacterium J06628_6]
MPDFYAESLTPDADTELLATIDLLPDEDRRRFKAAMALSLLWSFTLVLHLFAWGTWVVACLTVIVGWHVVRVVRSQPQATPLALPSVAAAATDAAIASPASYPYISLLVAAKNEASVIEGLVESLCQLDYPRHRYDLWIINDNSNDQTGEILDRLKADYPQLHVIHRGADAIGGKSGALNLVWPRTQGDILAVFDADAQVPPDLLRQVVPMLTQKSTESAASVGAVQVRKAIANASLNFWTRGQRAEMALDSYYQQQRVALGGIGELRGNGQFIRRDAITQCGGWNEETITDDLDLTLRLHLENWDIAFLNVPAVQEEGVTQGISLWHQRNRWAEGGYQRYLDYWRPIVQRLSLLKLSDLLAFMVMQYLIPIAAVPDLVFAVVRHRPPVYTPLTTLTVGISCWGMFMGIRRTQPVSVFSAVGQTLQGIVYMMHWAIVMSTTTLRVAVRPKRLKWVKTVHTGDREAQC